MALELEPDIILMDIMLAGKMDGIEAADDHQGHQDIPFIFLTAYTDEKTLERAKEVEPYGYILKPFKERELYTTIDIALYKHEMEGKLTRQERLFSAILHSINDGIIATDMDLNVQFMNPWRRISPGFQGSRGPGQEHLPVPDLTDSKTQKDLLSNSGQHGRAGRSSSTM